MFPVTQFLSRVPRFYLLIETACIQENSTHLDLLHAPGNWQLSAFRAHRPVPRDLGLSSEGPSWTQGLGMSGGLGTSSLGWRP